MKIATVYYVVRKCINDSDCFVVMAGPGSYEDACIKRDKLDFKSKNSDFYHEVMANDIELY